MASRDNSVNSARLFELLEKANILFTSEKEITRQIDDLILKFETGISFFNEDVLPTVQAMKDFYAKNLDKLSKKYPTTAMGELITELLELLDYDFFIRIKGD